MKDRSSNRLIHEKSPYLLQHAYNPVDWYPWGLEAFTKAESEDRPIFLSIGYSTCHWCHVMEKESFEDQTVAEILNTGFIAVKVDREERPDIDSNYMKVCQMMTGGGGWPLTIIMTPDRKPFYAGTYIPKESRYGRAGLLDLLKRISDIWNSERESLMRTTEQVLSMLKQSEMSLASTLDESTLKKAYQQLNSRYDPSHGGFGAAPKFPSPHNIIYLLHYWYRTREPKALEIAEHTLTSMRRGGIYDHIGYGFHRYSTDVKWLVPHFEKMLYDQALHLIAYTEAYQATGKELYAETAREIIEYISRDMTSPEGGFYSAEDADSEGEEGRFYLWTLQALEETLSDEQLSFIQHTFNIDEKGNYLDEATRERNRRNILHTNKGVEQLAREMGLSLSDYITELQSISKILYKSRERRVHPYKDDKILTAWNSLMIAALAKASTSLGGDIVNTAERAYRFIHSNMRNRDGLLLRRYRDGEAAVLGFLDDYAYTIWGLLELYEATFKIEYLQHAVDLQEIQDHHFWDPEKGGYYFNSMEHEEILFRNKEAYDGAIPSGNSVSMLNLSRLGRITGETRYDDKAALLMDFFSEKLSISPSSYSFFTAALAFAMGTTHEIVIVGDPRSNDTKEMIQTLRETYNPYKVVLVKPIDESASIVVQLASFTQHHIQIDSRATAYVCRNHECMLPTTEPDKMKQLMA